MVDIRRIFSRRKSTPSQSIIRYVGNLSIADLARIDEQKLQEAIKLRRKDMKAGEKARKKLEAKVKPIKEEIAKLDQERIRLAKEIKKHPTLAPYELLPQLDKVLDQINQQSARLERLGIPSQVWDRIPDDPIRQIQYVKGIVEGKIFRGET